MKLPRMAASEITAKFSKYLFWHSLLCFSSECLMVVTYYVNVEDSSIQTAEFKTLITSQNLVKR